MLVIKKMLILIKYLDFSDFFLEEKASILPETTNLKQHIIKLQKDQQLFYKLIYSLNLVKLETLKTYIKINLINGFI